MFLRKIFRNTALILLNFVLAAAFAYCCYLSFISYKVYKEVKSNARGWSGRVHQCSSELGFAPIPGAFGEHIFPIGDNIPMQYSRDGFRVPVNEDIDTGRRPLFLFLGCSYTYGDACRAEDTFAYLVGRHYHGTAINAGVCGYGLAQMYLQATKLIPQYRPDVVIVQYSDWLVNRATREFSPTYFSQMPSPYFIDRGDGFALAPPVFRTNMFDCDISSYRKTKAGVVDFLSFVTGTVFPLKLHDDSQFWAFLVKKLSGAMPRPTRRKQEALDFCYREIQKVCADNKARMIIVGLKQESYTISPEFAFVDAEKGLREKLAPDTDYAHMYAHWRGKPPVKVDNHPNPPAHRIIAAQLIGKIDGLLPSEYRSQESGVRSQEKNNS